ncbi:DNA mismatch repair protein MutS [Echinicola strongylocentroti]|uniref:DNA mismatch repair protein MutS n=1 Tax=Echinicola strongylocentroti TaxID=1795355 RepID=A0A2Z4ILA5_9BACT|nr:Smr/MutS family protein [Echinicola strongylocentroti]AWW31517.1 DNA mismatch repair protein MutS [Echinicola strongylocentroti]
MNIGDKVRLLHGNEEGTITRISGSGRIEIEIEDGFKIPAMKNEVVVIHQTEKEYFGEGQSAIPQTAPLEAPKSSQPQGGIFISYIPLNDKDLSVHLINNTDKDYLFMASEIFGDNSRTLASGNFSAKTSLKIDEKVIAQFEKWPELFFRFIPINHKAEKTQPAFEKKVKFKASSFFKSQQTAPLTGKKGYLFTLNQQTKDLNIKELNQDLNEESAPQPNEKQFKRPEKEIDLHIEKLADDHEFMSNSEMLRLQMETFEKNLNYAIASGMDEISFIHGIGNGVLRKEIHKYLSQLENIKYFQDTQKSRFGYGATFVRIN